MQVFCFKSLNHFIGIGFSIFNKTKTFMKPFKFFLPIILMSGVVSLSAVAQKRLTEGVLQYKISIASSKAGSKINDLNDAELAVYIKPTSSRAEMKSSLGTESTVFNNKLNSGYILKEYSGQKLMITMTAANWDQKNKPYEALKFNISNELTTIGGYSCKKATGTMPDGKAFTVYFDPTVVIANTNYNNAFSNLPGLPVQYEIQSGDLSFKYTLTNLSYETVPVAKIDAPKTGFRVMTYEENQQLKKQPGK
jgi:GLPGLI family protein